MFDLSKGGHHGADPKNHAWNFSSITSNKFLQRYSILTQNYLNAYFGFKCVLNMYICKLFHWLIFKSECTYNLPKYLIGKENCLIFRVITQGLKIHS